MVRPKKHLGQHFLKEPAIAEKIVNSLTNHGEYAQVLEIGPGTGVLTQFLVRKDYQLTVVEIDTESVTYLRENYKEDQFRIISGDFLKMEDGLPEAPFAIIGNFPYNISSQIFFKLLKIRNQVPEVVGMLQKEVAERISSPPGSKVYGILSVLLQAYYDIEYLFTVEPGSFNPPPKVNSGVIRLKRNTTQSLDCNEELFTKLVKQGFQNRRKTLRNALKSLNLPASIIGESILDKRAEQLSVQDFVKLTKDVEEGWKL